LDNKTDPDWRGVFEQVATGRVLCLHLLLSGVRAPVASNSIGSPAHEPSFSSLMYCGSLRDGKRQRGGVGAPHMSEEQAAISTGGKLGHSFPWCLKTWVNGNGETFKGGSKIGRDAQTVLRAKGRGDVLMRG